MSQSFSISYFSLFFISHLQSQSALSAIDVAVKAQAITGTAGALARNEREARTMRSASSSPVE